MDFSALRLAAATAVVALLATGCAGDTSTPEQTTTTAVRLYGSDGNMSNSLGASLENYPGVLASMKGTAPLAPLTDDFKARLRSVEPGLDVFSYAGHSYDAVVLAALAAETARTSNPREIAKYLPGVTTGGTECSEVADCLRLVRAGTDIQYRGVSLRRGGFTDAGEPATATYGTVHFNRQNRLDDAKTEYVGAGNVADTTQSPQPAAPQRRRPEGAPLTIGGLLPKTGQLAGMYAPLAAGVHLAVKEINDAGGVLGEPVVFIDGDDGTDPEVASGTVDRLLAAKVNVIIGAGASGVTKAVLPKVTGAGVLMISPSATSDELTSIEDDGLFFRTAPPDRLQARALADIVLRDGVRKIFMVVRDDSWGQGLYENLRTQLTSAGVRGEDIKALTYQPGETAEDKPVLTGLVDQVKEFAPEGIVILGFDESSHVITTLIEGGVELLD